MKNNIQFFFGMDYYKVDLPVTYFLNQVHYAQIDIFDLKTSKEGISFFAPIYQRKKILRTFKKCDKIKTVGVLGFFFRQLNQPFRVFLFLWCIALFQILNHTILDITYQATSPSLSLQIEHYLNEQGYKVPFINFNNQLEEELKDNIEAYFKTEIAWLEITRDASKIHIAFNDKRYAETKVYDNTPLIAHKSGMITRFDVTHGEKLVDINDIVYEGDILVDNVLYDAFNLPQDVYVEGSVWAKTWTTIESSIELDEASSILQPLHFTRLLMQCRSEIEKELSEGEEIISESILHFGIKEGKIEMKIHYTCIEDISRP